jgi:hypothetical protein
MDFQLKFAQMSKKCGRGKMGHYLGMTCALIALYRSAKQYNVSIWDVILIGTGLLLFFV